MQEDISSSKIVLIKDNVIKEIREQYIIDLLKQDLLSSGEEQSIAEFYNQYGVITEQIKKVLDPIEPKILSDDVDTCYLAYQNVVVALTKTEIAHLDYKDLPGMIWDSQIIDRDFGEEDGTAVFQQFIQNCASNNYDTIRSVIGYCVHSYKDPSNSRAIILQDKEMYAGDADGGTGKSLITNAIGKIRRSVKKDGKQIGKNPDRFFYQDYEEGVKIIVIDDINVDFTLETIFSSLTEGLKVEKKFKNSRFINFSESPKFMITSNHPVKCKPGASSERRKFEVELSDYYGLDHTPLDEFKHRFFDEWSAEEWFKFDEFMIGCVQLYLIYGLIDYDKSHLKEKQKIQLTSQAFHLFYSSLSLDKELSIKVMHRKYKEAEGSESQHMFTKYLKRYSRICGQKFIGRRSNGNDLFKIETIRKNENTTVKVML
jgi:hypothetical protein